MPVLQKVVLQSPAELNGALVTAACVERLRRELPQCQIDILCERAVAAVFESHPQVSQVHCVQFETKFVVRSKLSRLSNKIRKIDLYLKASQRLRQEQYDRIYWKPTPTPIQTVSRRLGQQLFVWASAIRNAKSSSEIDCQSEPCIPTLKPRMDLAYARHKFDLSVHLPTVVFVLGSARLKPIDLLQANRSTWANRHWVELAYALQERFGKCQVVLLGSTAERHRATEVAALVGPLAFNLCGQTKLHEVIGLIAASHAVVGMDHPYMSLAVSLSAVTVDHSLNRPHWTPNDTANAIEKAHTSVYAKIQR
jgi:ADP-heptose:LPS heptosyltransferase